MTQDIHIQNDVIQKTAYLINATFFVFLVAIHFFFIALVNSTLIFASEEDIEMEANYILSCQYINLGNPGHGAINNISGDPTWVVPRENAMAILGLITASEVLNNSLFFERAQMAADYLISIQDPTDGAWCNQYSFSSVVDSAKSPTQTAEVIIALYNLGYTPARYDAMRQGAQYLMTCQDTANIGGFDHGLLGGGKDASGIYYTWRWASDNAYAYWAIKAAEFWATIENDAEFTAQCAESAENILEGINTYLYNPATSVWHIAIDGDGTSMDNPDLPAPHSALASWINYAPQMLDVPAIGVNSPLVGDWIRDTFQQVDGSCIGYAWESGEPKTRKYPGLSFQASLCWYDTGHLTEAENALLWAEESGLWQTSPDGNGITGGWKDWREISPVEGLTADWWLRFIDTSFYSIACLNGGYNFQIDPWLLRTEAPWYKEEFSNYSASAASKTVLDYIREDTILTQEELYLYGHSHNNPVNAGIPDIDPQGIRDTLNHYHPAGYNFAIRTLPNVTDSMRDICHWLDYEVPVVSISNVPAIVPTFGSYDNWMSIIGACANHDPSASDTFRIFGFWVHDPAVVGIGANSYKTAQEFKDTYFLPLVTADMWNGQYVSICEPPEITSSAKVTMAFSQKTIASKKLLQLIQLQKSLPKKYMQKYWTNLAKDTPAPSACSKILRNMAQFNWEKITDYHLLLDRNFKQLLLNSVPQTPIKVKRLDKVNKDYYLIAFDKIFNFKYLTYVVFIIDAQDGYFKEASWAKIPVKYLPVTQEDAIQLVANKIHTKNIYLKNIKAELVWFPCARSSSPYYPFWKVEHNGKTWYVYQDKTIQQAK
jgi:hypothetical protein